MNPWTIGFGIFAILLSLGFAVLTRDEGKKGLARRLGYLGDGANLQVALGVLGVLTVVIAVIKH
jgi:hypothetical protein